MEKLHVELFSWLHDKVTELVRYGQAALKRSLPNPATRTTSEHHDMEQEEAGPHVGLESSDCAAISTTRSVAFQVAPVIGTGFVVF